MTAAKIRHSPRHTRTFVPCTSERDACARLKVTPGKAMTLQQQSPQSSFLDRNSFGWHKPFARSIEYQTQPAFAVLCPLVLHILLAHYMEFENYDILSLVPE
ncbi:hypothetical protein TNCT_662701 [Trichonephila clavata]|uniref:Uncharacterized protein n=1 Tax=Trichonephila clavata TaxID=2740835 RepID=A0A8X6FYB2_TRICU|nr:hypothetical protein TNCT_662701 [Trichonephila clavata]